MDPLDSAAKSIEEAAPRPNEAAIEAERASAKASPEGPLDKHGQPFDAAIHVVDGDGKPSLTVTGRLKLKPGRRTGATGQTTSRPHSQLNIPGSRPDPGTPEHATQQSALVAAYTVNAVQSVGMMLGGEEWRYMKDEKIGVDEFVHGLEVWTRFYDVNGIRDIPPNLALAIWGGSYVIPRLFLPKTKTRMKRASEWMKTKLRRKDRAHADSRDDRVRKDDGGDGAVSTPPDLGLVGGGAGPTN